MRTLGRLTGLATTILVVSGQSGSDSHAHRLLDDFTRAHYIPAQYAESFRHEPQHVDWHQTGALPLPIPASPGVGAATTGIYRNLFVEMGLDPAVVQQRVDEIVSQFLYGDPETESVLTEVGDGTAYITDIGHGDVRSEGMSYGMMLAVQLDNSTLFDLVWSWAKQNMRHNNPTDPRYGYFAWHCTPSGDKINQNSASDGESYFITALYMAASRWNNPTYTSEADELLGRATSKSGVGGITRIFVDNTGVAVAPAQVVFVPENDGATFTDPSYHMPAFYTVWQETASSTSVANFAGELAASSREFFKLAAQSSTPGLMPDYSTFAGVPTGSRQDHEFDAWRVAMNVAIDYSWHAADPWQVDYCNRLLEFHKAQNVSGPYPDRYTLPNLQPLSNGHGPGPIGMNAVCALASNKAVAWDFVDELWNTDLPTGRWRYYDGWLYLWGWLHLSGNYKVYSATPSPTVAPTTTSPSNAPTASAPTTSPTVTPTETPTLFPTNTPTTSPSSSPTTSMPTTQPTLSPTNHPMISPSNSPTTNTPTTQPTVTPTLSPVTASPSISPTTSSPTTSPMRIPTVSPSTSPMTSAPTISPTDEPTISPTFSPTTSPSTSPSTSTPTTSPTITPTMSPATSTPSQGPTIFVGMGGMGMGMDSPTPPPPPPTPAPPTNSGGMGGMGGMGGNAKRSAPHEPKDPPSEPSTATVPLIVILLVAAIVTVVAILVRSSAARRGWSSGYDWDDEMLGTSDFVEQAVENEDLNCRRY
eukprot:m.333880 g.333880  ORF g.333880 m.333880 type:complete len:756 (-) comp16524_c0_seq1:128-2395(-)